jgi:heat shock protein HspQ
MKPSTAKFAIDQMVKNRKSPFRGIVYDVDPVFTNTETWRQAIPKEVRPRKDQPFYHLFAENAENEDAYVSAQNLMTDPSAILFVIRKRTRCSCARIAAPTKSRRHA